MRKKSITAFVSVYIALCVAYGVAGRMMSAPNLEAAETVQAETYQYATETATQNNSSESVQPDEPTEATKTAASEQEEQSSTESIFSPTEIYEEAAASITEAETEAKTEAPTEIREQTESDETYQEVQIEPETEPAQNVPSLEEFLRNLRCSGCRHNCSLLSPRCMNGARKASQAESEYHEMYNI